MSAVVKRKDNNQANSSLKTNAKTSQDNSEKGFSIENLSYYLMIGFLGGPKLFPSRYLVNSQKGATFFWVAGLMYYYQNFSLGAYLYLGLHGSYGLLWILKDVTFGDKVFLNKVTIGSAVLTVAFTSLYWIPSYLLLSGASKGNNPSEIRVFYSIVTYVFGIFFMLCTDAQKYYLLKYKKGLLDEGMFAMNRNTNYLGEMLIYGSFAMVSSIDISWMILIPIWVTLFNLNMYCKDLSLRKKDGWERYSTRSYRFLFKLFDSDLANLVLYCALVVLGYFAYQKEGLFSLLRK